MAELPGECRYIGLDVTCATGFQRPLKCHNSGSNVTLQAMRDAFGISMRNRIVRSSRLTRDAVGLSKASGCGFEFAKRSIEAALSAGTHHRCGSGGPQPDQRFIADQMPSAGLKRINSLAKVSDA